MSALLRRLALPGYRTALVYGCTALRTATRRPLINTGASRVFFSTLGRKEGPKSYGPFGNRHATYAILGMHSERNHHQRSSEHGDRKLNKYAGFVAGVALSLIGGYLIINHKEEMQNLLNSQQLRSVEGKFKEKFLLTFSQLQKTASALDSHSSETNRKELNCLLNQSFSELQRMLTLSTPRGIDNEISALFYLIGKTLQNNKLSIHFLQLSFIVQLKGLKSLNKQIYSCLAKCTSIEEANLLLSRSIAFENITETVLRERLHSLPQYNVQTYHQLAQTLRLLGEAYLLSPSPPLQLINSMYENIEIILDLIDTQESRLSKFEMLVHKNSLLLKKADSGQIQLALESLEDVLIKLKHEQKLNSQSTLNLFKNNKIRILEAEIYHLQAKVYYKQFCKSPSITPEFLLAAYHKATKAMEISTSIKTFDPLLNALVANQLAMIIMACLKNQEFLQENDFIRKSPHTEADIQLFLNITEKYMEKNGIHSNPQNANFLLTKAQFEFVQGRLQNAKDYLRQIRQLAKIFPIETSKVVREGMALQLAITQKELQLQQSSLNKATH